MAFLKHRGRKPRAGEIVTVVGAGRSGRAVAKLLARHDAKVRLLEQNPQAISAAVKAELEACGIELLFGPHKAEYFENAAFAVPSPGMPIAELRKLLPSGSNAEITAETEMAWRFLDEEPVLAVTGTSGKTTTASLAAAMLKAQGYAVFLGGNIGTPLSEYLLDARKADVIVLEVSSFQLQGCSTFCPRAAILLNITPNHLDYHKDMREYAEAKFRIFRCQNEDDLAIIDESLQKAAKSHALKGRTIWLQDRGTFKKLQLAGRHNFINAEAAWQAARLFGVSLENAERAASEFQPLPHRLEKVCQKEGVLFINDSKCTTVDSLKVALEAMNRPVRLLCGGKFKGGDLKALIPLLKEKVREVALFGASREIFEEAWQGELPISWHPNLESAMRSLKNHACLGEVILLSPATSSYDAYKNYMERGEDFKRIAGSFA